MIRRLARPLLAATFIAEGVDALRNPTPHVQQARAAGLDDAERLVQVNAATKVGGGALLALDKLPRLSALALAASLVPTTLVRNAFWSEDDPQARAQKKSGLVTDLGLLGGLLVATADTGGRESVPHAAARLSRRARRKAAKRAAAAHKKAARAQHKAGEVVHAAAEALPLG
ncbi:MAG TPA: DoxX family membrane protein [Mycobacteriales bacterium]|nr:DoxX family membrane protein [Mycobacteriales bacterium]